MQPLQADLEHPHKETRPQTLAKCSWIVGSRFGARAMVEESGAAHWPDAASNGTPLASGHAAVCVPSSGFAFAKRTVGFDLGRAVFRFRGKDWVLYMMALKPCHRARAVFLD